MPSDEDYIRDLRFCGLKYREIEAVTGVPKALCIHIVREPQWPKLVTRIEADGSWQLVRYP